jgi:hypothetical protein
MESDWEVEIGNEAPVIDACWEGFVDLRVAPERAVALAETKDFPALADTLVRLNALSSPVWTSKCDLWKPDSFDADELDAPAGAGNYALACYIDLLPRGDRQWPGPAQAVAFCQQLCAILRDVPQRCCRADLVVRRAYLAPNRPGLGTTAYLTACGPAPAETRATLASALVAIANALEAAACSNASSKLQ